MIKLLLIEDDRTLSENIKEIVAEIGEQLNQYGVRKASFSKYTQTYQRHLFKKEDIQNVI